jgi:hypothetical protein
MRMLILIASLVCLIACSPSESLAQQGDHEIPFTLEKGHIIVAAKIKDNVPVEMALAPGLEFSVLGTVNITKHKLKAYYTADGIVTGRNDRVIDYAQVTDVRLFDTEAKTTNFRFGDGTVNTISKRIGREIFGVLGADFFKGRTVQFDFKKKVVRVLSNWKVPKQGSDSVAVLPMLVDTLRPVRRPIVERVRFNDKPVKTLIDTGSVMIISFTPSGAKEIGLPAPPEKGDPQPAKVSLALEQISFTDVPAMVHSKNSVFDKESSGYSAVIGIGVLQNFIVTFDFGGAVIVLEKNQ